MTYKGIFLGVLAVALAGPSSWSVETRGVIDLGGQVVGGDTKSSKFDEYKDIPRATYVDRLSLNLEGDLSYVDYVEIEGSRLGLKDQKISVEVGEWGVHKLGLTYDQTPHNYSNTARTFLRDNGDGNYSLPDRLQWDLQLSTGSVAISTSNPAAFFSDAPDVSLRVDRKKTSLSYAYNPAGRWRASFGYQAEQRVGQKAIGVTYGHGQIQEALEPVDYQTHEFSLGSEYAGQDLGFSANYTFSLFANAIKALTLDNPFQLADGALSASGSSTPGEARLTLPPDNQSHQLNLALTKKLTAKSHLTTAFSMAAQFQNESFLPFTINSVLLNDARLPSLPQGSLNGKVYTINGSANWNWKPTTKASFSLHGRHYNVDNKTPSLLFDNYIPYDTALSTSAPTRTFSPTRSRRSLSVAYDKTNSGADVYYSLARNISARLAYNWERVGRKFRETEATKEDIYSASLNFGPWRGVMLRPGAQYARRVSGDYSAHRVAEETYPLGEGTALGQLDGARKFDEAARKRKIASLRADWDALDFLSVGVDEGVTMDDYLSEYGVLDQKSVYHSIDANISASEKWSLYTDYTLETIETKTRSRYRETAAFDLADNDWLGRLKDTVHTVGLGANYAVIENKLDANLDLTSSYAKGVQQASNPSALSGTTAQQASALAIDLPNTYNRLSKGSLTLRYRWLETLGTHLRYEYQRYSQIDWSQDSLDVWEPIWNKSVFLGATQADFAAHLFSLGLSFHF